MNACMTNAPPERRNHTRSAAPPHRSCGACRSRISRDARFCASSSNAAATREEAPRPAPPTRTPVASCKKSAGIHVPFFLPFCFFSLLFKIVFSSRSSVVHEEVHDGLVVVSSGPIQRSLSTITLQIEVRISLEQFSDSGLFSPINSPYQRSHTTIILCVYLCTGLQEQWYGFVVTMVSRPYQSSPAVSVL